MKKLILIFLLLVSASYGQNTFFQIVESVPKETSMVQSRLPRTQTAWLDMINGAKTTLDIEMFYFANKKGEALEPVMEAIKNAAGRGVIVRIIVDSSFYSGSEKSVDELAGINNITIAKISFKNVGGGVMHAKYMVADERDLYIGSANMDWRALDHIHEMGVRIKNRKLAKNFETIFSYDWNNSDIGRNTVSGEPVSLDEIVNSSKKLFINTRNYGSVTLYPCFSPIGKIPEGFDSEESQLLDIINNARFRLNIQMYSYSTKDYSVLDEALRNAAARGVQIKIIFANWSIRKGATEVIQSLSQVPNIEIKFGSIPEHSSGFIPYARVEHCKYFIADNNVSWISTSNWEKGYFYGSRNATLAIKNKKVNKTLRKVFMTDWNSQYTETVDPAKTYESVKRN